MPCGGIYPLTQHFASEYFNPDDPTHTCFHCGQLRDSLGQLPSHFCDEWDCYLHAACIDAFLAGEEGQIVLAHGHEVVR